MTLQPVADELELLPARADTDSWTTVVAEVATLAQKIADTEFVPKGLRGSVPATAAAILYGREVGLPPMTALSQIAVVDGRPGLSAEAMRALVLAAGHELVIEESTAGTCTMRGRRHRSSAWTSVTWTIDQARYAGLLRKGSGWEHYPRAMLIARATTELCRNVFPDVIHGFRSTEELDDMGAPAPAEEPRSRRTTVRRQARNREIPPQTTAPEATTTGETSAASDAVPTADVAPATQEPDATSVPSSSSPPIPAPDEDAPEEAEERSSRRRGRHSASPSTPTPPPETEVPPDPMLEPQLELEVPTYRRPEPADEPAEPPMNNVTRKIVFGQLRRLGRDDDTIGRRRRLDLLAQIAGLDRLDTSADLTQTQAAAIATVLATARNSDELDDLLAVATVSEIATPVEEDDKGGQ